MFEDIRLSFKLFCNDKCIKKWKAMNYYEIKIDTLFKVEEQDKFNDAYNLFYLILIFFFFFFLKLFTF